MKIAVFISLVLIYCNAASQISLKLHDEGRQRHLSLDKGNEISCGPLTLQRQNQIIHQGPAGKTSTAKTAMPFVFYTLLFINPMLVIEDNKTFFGLTREISFGYYPFGRAAFEYSYIFRDRNTSHLRFSYNYDFILEAADFAAVVTTPGAGYFTDTHNKGWFGQISGGLMITAEVLLLYPYLRYRHTFIQNKVSGKTDIDDISLGISLVFFLNGM